MVYNNEERKLNHRVLGTCWLEFRPPQSRLEANQIRLEFVINTTGKLSFGIKNKPELKNNQESLNERKINPRRANFC